MVSEKARLLFCGSASDGSRAGRTRFAEEILEEARLELVEGTRLGTCEGCADMGRWRPDERRLDSRGETGAIQSLRNIVIVLESMISFMMARFPSLVAIARAVVPHVYGTEYLCPGS